MHIWRAAQLVRRNQPLTPTSHPTHPPLHPAHMTEPADPAETALQTVTALSARLRRLEFVLTGTTSPPLPLPSPSPPSSPTTTSAAAGPPSAAAATKAETDGALAEPGEAQAAAAAAAGEEGDDDDDDNDDDDEEGEGLGEDKVQKTVAEHLASLQRDLQKLQAKSRTVAEILAICNHPAPPPPFPRMAAPRSNTGWADAAYPFLFSSIPGVPPLPDGSDDDDDGGAVLEQQAAVVLAAAASFHAAASQLSSVADTPVPAASASAGLVALLPRLQRAQVVQAAQQRRAAELRARSARVLEQWFLLGVDGVNQCFTEWDERTFAVDRTLSRAIAAAAREE